MNHLLEVCVVGLALATGIPAFVAAQSVSAVPKRDSFAGTWEGKTNDLPAINLELAEADGKISGMLVFYVQKRSDPDGPWHVEGNIQSAVRRADKESDA